MRPDVELILDIRAVNGERPGWDDIRERGRLERRIELPAQYPTIPALGGPGDGTLYVTTASYPVRASAKLAHRGAGGLFAHEAPARGLPTSYMSPSEEPLQ